MSLTRDLARSLSNGIALKVEVTLWDILYILPGRTLGIYQQEFVSDVFRAANVLVAWTTQVPVNGYSIW